MQLYFNDKPCTLEQLKEIFNNLETCPADSGSFEVLEVDEINNNGIYFTISSYSTF